MEALERLERIGVARHKIPSGEVTNVLALLAEETTVYSDGGGRVRAAGRPIMDQIDGLELYIRTAETDRMNLAGAPDLTTEQFDSTFKTNVYAMFWLCRAALPRMTAWMVSPSASASSSRFRTTTPAPFPSSVPAACASKARQCPSGEPMPPS